MRSQCRRAPRARTGDQTSRNGDGKQAFPLSLAQFLKRGRPAPRPGDNNATIVVHTFASRAGVQSLVSPYTPQAACLRATYSGNTQPPRPLGSAQSTDCQHDQLTKQLQFARGDL